ncbi:MAG: hypothetical protein J6J42_13470 [Lachnospiraceae bacterium]|nr:hypothetical protein [Lachnospiraceae bacterium]
MNMLNALSAYGAQQKESTAKTLSNPTADAAGKTSASSVSEAILYTDETTLEQKQTSEIYSKNGMGEEKKAQEVKEEGTEAEKNQERLDNVSSRMTAEDMAQLQKEGFPVGEMTVEQLEAAMERIKLQKELAANAVENQVQQIQDDRAAVIEQAIKMLSGNPKAEMIADKLVKANIPITQANLEKVAVALEKANGGIKLTPAECEYMVRNKLVPTLENVAMARSAAQTYNKKEHTLTPEAWAQLEPKVTHMLFQAGLRNNNDMINAAQTFIKRDIPLTVENLKSYSLLAGIRLSEEDILTKAVNAISVGQDPKNANLLSSTAKEVRQIMRKTEGVTGQAVDYAAARKAMEQPGVSGDKLDLSLGDLAEVQELIDSDSPDVKTYMQTFVESSAAQAASIRARRQLEEIRAKMTYESGYRLAKEGIRIDTVSMEKLIDNLKTLEARFFSSFFTQAGMAATAEGMEMLKDTSRKLEEIKNMPAPLIVDTMDTGTKITLNELHETGMNHLAMRRYNETFETVMTSPNKLFGDNLQKAFGNVDSLLQNIGLPANMENRRAVRMLGHSSVEITQENVEKVRDYDSKLQEVLKELHPAVTVRMIRDGLNPLEQPIEDLSAKIAQIKEEEGITTEDNYSIFLINLEKKKEITPEERQAYIGVYRALHQVGGSEEEAIGNVYRQGQELTLQNLLTAVRSGRAQGIDAYVNETFRTAAGASSEKALVEDQINAGMLGIKFGKGAQALNNLAEKVDNTISECSQNTEEVAQEQLTTVRTLATEGQNATRFLEDFNILTTMENLEAAKNLLADDMTIFKEWKRFKFMENGEEPVLPDFVECMEDKETMQAAYQKFMKETGDLKAKMTQDPSMTRQDTKSIKKMNVGIRFMNRLSKREYYQIPVDTGTDIVNMNVTILETGEDKAKAKVTAEIPTMNLGKISCEASIQDNKLKCFISSDNREGTQALKDRQMNLFASLAQGRIQIGSIYYGTEEVRPDTYAYQTEGAYKDTPEGEGAQDTDNSRLYRIAKALVVHVRNADMDVAMY